MQLQKNLTKRLFGGSLVGAVNGLFGGGGGMIAVPVLTGILGYGEKEAHATAIFVIAPVCAASAAAYIAEGYYRAGVAVPVAIGAVLGGLLGANFLNKLPKNAVKIIFVAVMLFAGLRLLWP